MSEKKKHGDRFDAKRVQGLDTMHVFMPYVLGKRTDNEAVMNELIDMTAIKKFIAEKNADSPEFKYTVFHVLTAAIAKTIALRPKLNYYIINYKYYQRDLVSLAFTVKKKFDDHSSEGLAIIRMKPDSTDAPLDYVYNQIKKIVYSVRKENIDDNATDIMSTLIKLPAFLLKIIVKAMIFMDKHNMLPKDVVLADPYHCTAFISNLGSIKMSATYHHLSNWGTNSFFAIIGEMQKHPFYNDDGTYELRDALTLGLTIDERIADGYYFTKSVKLLKHLIANPELLEKPLNEEIDY